MTFVLSRRAFTLGAALLATGVGATRAFAQQAFFRIGTGGTQGTYFPVGGIIANSISATGPAGVEGLIATATASNGSVANINAIQSGASESRLHPVRRRLMGA
ncbi:hypothetical protein GCM10016234_14380 [Tianweitania populi]|uniref:TAXI family TRAP transporter solute-binding subunit n=1 Tax=Tianweitania populi TaxID=1607949 RepID=A0A8J3GK68_9HYPH|nr:hypothetical protein GCM10016234_14380 [Tianweitania populi]